MELVCFLWQSDHKLLGHLVCAQTDLGYICMCAYVTVRGQYCIRLSGVSADVNNLISFINFFMVISVSGVCSTAGKKEAHGSHI